MLHVLLEHSRKPALAMPLTEPLPPEPAHTPRIVVRCCLAKGVFHVMRMATAANMRRCCCVAAKVIVWVAEGTT